VIGYLEGNILKKENDRIILLVNQIGYEVLLPTIVMDTLRHMQTGDEVALYIYYHQTERQPKPVLIGFNLEVEREFFQYFISVEDIGPLKALKALTIPVSDIAHAIESKDAGQLKRLKGIGNRTAQKIIASLEGKMGKFALIRKPSAAAAPIAEDLVEQVLAVLVGQLGHKTTAAKEMIGAALERNPTVTTAEALFEEVYRASRKP
jgi:Holliday junction DNA helicase RuvA